MKHVTPAAMLLLGFAALALAQAPEPTVDLRPQWQARQTSRYHFTTTRTQRVTMSARGDTRDMSTTLTSEGELTWRVTQVKPDGSYACEMTLDWMTAAMTGPDGRKHENDSRRASGDVPPVHDLLRAMAGVPLSVSVAPDGRIAKVGNVEAIRRRAADEQMVPEDLDFIESATDLATLVGAPPRLSPGGAWSADFRWTHEMGFVEQPVRYRLVSVEEIAGIPVATIEGTAKTRLEVDRSDIPPQAPPIDVRLTVGRHNSLILFDLLRHEAVGRLTVDTRTIDVTVRLPNPPGPVTRRIHETISSQTLRISENP